MTKSIYVDGKYLALNPTFHIEDAAWKKEQIYKMLEKHDLHPLTVCEVRCWRNTCRITIQFAN